MTILKEHLRLLMKREGKVVLGRHYSNLWLLTLVLLATFVSIAFSNGSLRYLSDKMNDPFTNWVNVENKFKGGEDELRNALNNPEIQERYGFSGVQSDFQQGQLFFKYRSFEDYYLPTRFFETMNSQLMERILSPDNVVAGCSVNVNELDDQTFGFVITRDALEKMGYNLDSIPPYLNFMATSMGIDTLGLLEGTDYINIGQGKSLMAKAPMPVLAVVRRLPMNMDMVASKFFISQCYGEAWKPLNMDHEEYYKSLNYFVSDGVRERFNQVVLASIPDSLLQGQTADDIVLTYDDATLISHLKSWKSGDIVKICIGFPNTELQAYHDIARKIALEFSEIEVCRVFDYNATDYTYTQFTHLSVPFNHLDSIRSFEQYVKENFQIQIEMSQVNSKENFNAVSRLAGILSWAMIVFAIVCILIFIVNMLQSYFQKVKHNLGTFKAFGISSAELTRVYVLIMLAIVCTSVVVALVATWLIQSLMRLVGILKEGEYDYLLLWDTPTCFITIAIIVLATAATVFVVMGRLLKQTPGDLIYDRE